MPWLGEVVFSLEEQGAFMKIQTMHGVDAAEIHRSLAKACSTDALSSLRVRGWSAHFRSGRQSVKDKPRSGRPCESTDDVHVESVRVLINNWLVRRWQRKSGCQLHLLIKFWWSTWTELHKSQPNGCGTRWLMTRSRCVSISLNNILSDKREGYQFWQRIVAIDETWLRCYKPELKRQLAEWRHSWSPCPKN